MWRRGCRGSGGSHERSRAAHPPGTAVISGSGEVKCNRTVCEPRARARREGCVRRSKGQIAGAVTLCGNNQWNYSLVPHGCLSAVMEIRYHQNCWKHLRVTVCTILGYDSNTLSCYSDRFCLKRNKESELLSLPVYSWKDNNWCYLSAVVQERIGNIVQRLRKLKPPEWHKWHNKHQGCSLLVLALPSKSGIRSEIVLDLSGKCRWKNSPWGARRAQENVSDPLAHPLLSGAVWRRSTSAQNTERKFM